MKNKDPEIAHFILLSEYLTDRKNLNAKIAGEYLNRLKLQLPVDTQSVLGEIDKVISTVPEKYWEFELKRRIIESDKFAPFTQQILRLWYTSQFVVADDKTDVRTREQYNEALLWKVVHTDAPGADKKKKYGFWKKHPVKK